MFLRSLFVTLLSVNFLALFAEAQNWVPINSGYMNSFLNGQVSENSPSAMNVSIPISGAPGVFTTGGLSQVCRNNFDWTQHPPVVYSNVTQGAGFPRDPTQYVITSAAQLITGFKFTGKLSGLAGPTGNTVIESVFLTTQPCFAAGLEFGFAYYPMSGVSQFYWAGHANCSGSICFDPGGNPVPQTGGGINFYAPFDTVLTWQVNAQPDPGSPAHYGFTVTVTNPATGQVVWNNGGFPIQPASDYNIGDFWQCFNSNVCGVPGYMVSTMYRQDTSGSGTTYYPFAPFMPVTNISSMFVTSQLLFFY